MAAISVASSKSSLYSSPSQSSLNYVVPSPASISSSRSASSSKVSFDFEDEGEGFYFGASVVCAHIFNRECHDYRQPLNVQERGETEESRVRLDLSLLAL